MKKQQKQAHRSRYTGQKDVCQLLMASGRGSSCKLISVRLLWLFREPGAADGAVSASPVLT